MTSLRPWKSHATTRGPDLHLFRTRYDSLENPRTGEVRPALVIESGDWCNVVAKTEAGEYLLVRQFRFGSGDFTLEIPGGAVDPGEDVTLAAQRELREETGYVAERWSSLGSVAPNPAFLNNRCHHFLAEDARRVGDPELDQGEDIEVLVVSERRLRDAIRSGEIDHALALTGLWRALEPATGGTGDGPQESESGT